MTRTNVVGKPPKEIARLTTNLRRRDLLDLLSRAVSLDVFFTAGEIAAARKMPKRAVLAAMKSGELPAHKPTPNRWLASLQAIREWDKRTAISPS
jgi:hypothetical protein